MKRRALLSAAVIAGAGCWARYIEPHWFDLTHTEIALPGAKPTRILHISDIHMSDGMLPQDLELGFNMGLKQRPDIICLTGDFVSSTIGFDAPVLTRMLRRAADTAPSLAVLGNHDGGRWLARYIGDPSLRIMSDLVEGAGVTLLHNRSVRLGAIRFAGVADLWSGQFDPNPAFAENNKREPTILLCHNPDGNAKMRNQHWNLMLSGHTHGGQARIPGVNPAWTPVDDKQFVSGLYSWEGRQLFITRGLGSPKHIRAFCRPEVSILEIASS